MARRSAQPEPEEEGVYVLYGPNGQEYRTRTISEATRMRSRGYSDSPPVDTTPVDTSGAQPNPEEGESNR